MLPRTNGVSSAQQNRSKAIERLSTMRTGRRSLRAHCLSRRASSISIPR